MPLRVTVLYGGQVSEAAGTAKEEVELGDGSTLGDLLGLLESRHGPRLRSALESLGQRLLLLVNGRSVPLAEAGSVRLSNGDFVSILPPVSGGLHKSSTYLVSKRQPIGSDEIRVSRVGPIHLSHSDCLQQEAVHQAGAGQREGSDARQV